MELQEILAALERLNERRRNSTLPGLSCSLQIYSDGTGFVLDGQMEEAGVFFDASHIVLAIDLVQ